MKHIFTVFFIFSCITALTAPIMAHPGGTDGSGGHYNRSTGEYHYHHGYPEHDHYDMDGDGTIDCPYDFKQNESSSGSGSSTRSSYTTNTRPVKTDENESEQISVPTPVEEPKETFLKKYGLTIISAVIFLLLLIYITCSIHNRKEAERAEQERLDKIREAEKKAQEEAKRIEQERLRRIIEERKQSIAAELYISRKKTALHIFENFLRREFNAICLKQATIMKDSKNCIKQPEEIVDVPPKTSVDASGYPCDSEKPYTKADPYWFSLSSTGVYHRLTCSYATLNKINVVQLNAVRDYRPCRKCFPVVPNISWLPEYNNIKSAITSLTQVTEHPCQKLAVIPVDNSPYEEMMGYAQSNGNSNATLLAKKMIYWFELEDAQALLRFMLYSQSSPDPVCTYALKILCANYESWDTELKKNCYQRQYPKVSEE